MLMVAAFMNYRNSEFIGFLFSASFSQEKS